MEMISIRSERTRIFDRIFKNYRDKAFEVLTFDGWSWVSSTAQKPACTIILRTPGALQALIQGPSDLTLGEAYIDGHIDVQGDLSAVFPIAEYLIGLASFESGACGLLSQLLLDAARWYREGPRHSMARDRASIASHYDQPVEFYQPWLGNSLAYSCAYFRSPNESLDAAQENKLELICRKLRLTQGERFLDVGCGWGSLVLHAALRHGAQSHGITLSRAQAAVATRRITEAGMARRCAVEFRDYRDVQKIATQFDKLSSVGMVEHVGRSNLRRYFASLYGMLKPGGLLLNQGIGRSTSSTRRRDSFIDKHVFPDGELFPLSETIHIAESVGLEVCDVQNLRKHYVRTLNLWVQEFQRNSSKILKAASVRTYRTWLLYMAGSAATFNCGDIAVYQVLFRRLKDQCGTPMMTQESCFQGWSLHDHAKIA